VADHSGAHNQYIKTSKHHDNIPLLGKSHVPAQTPLIERNYSERQKKKLFPQFPDLAKLFGMPSS
jgi:hypothetical protein